MRNLFNAAHSVLLLLFLMPTIFYPLEYKYYNVRLRLAEKLPRNTKRNL